VVVPIPVPLGRLHILSLFLRRENSWSEGVCSFLFCCRQVLFFFFHGRVGCHAPRRAWSVGAAAPSLFLLTYVPFTAVEPRVEVFPSVVMCVPVPSLVTQVPPPRTVFTFGFSFAFLRSVSAHSLARVSSV